MKRSVLLFVALFGLGMLTFYLRNGGLPDADRMWKAGLFAAVAAPTMIAYWSYRAQKRREFIESVRNREE